MRHVNGYLAHLRAAHMSSETLRAYQSDLRLLASYLAPRGLCLCEARPELLEDCLASRGNTAATMARRLATWRGFFDWLRRSGAVKANPAAELRRPRVGRRLPRALSITLVSQLLAHAAQDSSFRGVRTWALLELLYSSGARIGEALALTMPDVDLAEGQLWLHGKGDKQRLVPIAAPALSALSVYLERRRDRLARKGGGRRPAHVFLSLGGRRLSRNRASCDVRAAGLAAGLPGKLTAHMLRHSIATHLLQGGMNLREVQEFLGHEDVSTTQLYTAVTQTGLRASYLAAHPRAGPR